MTPRDVLLREEPIIRPFADFPRFAAKVAFAGPDECWEWQGALTNGYGTYCRACARVRMSNRKKVAA